MVLPDYYPYQSSLLGSRMCSPHDPEVVNARLLVPADTTVVSNSITTDLQSETVITLVLERYKLESPPV
jgi:hypothetical protein